MFRFHLNRQFKDKTIVILGNNPSIIGGKLGNKIDKYQLVMRVNLFQNDGFYQDLGTKTDLRFIGATLTSEHDKILAVMPRDEYIITTSKNKNKLTEYNISYISIPRKTPTFTFRFIREVCKDLEINNYPSKPPRSGIVILTLLLRFSNIKNITVYGFSTVIEDTMDSMLATGNDKYKYNEAKYYSNHCNPKIELDLLKELMNKGHVKGLNN